MQFKPTVSRSNGTIHSADAPAATGRINSPSLVLYAETASPLARATCMADNFCSCFSSSGRKGRITSLAPESMRTIRSSPEVAWFATGAGGVDAAIASERTEDARACPSSITEPSAAAAFLDLASGLFGPALALCAFGGALGAPEVPLMCGYRQPSPCLQ